jgi:Cu(I)/Ag(I) efflux system protein CusF
MKPSDVISPVLLALLAGCTSPSSDTGASKTTAASSTPPAESAMAPATRAATTGTVQSVDSVARTVTIVHGPVAALQWPAMTMTFKAPNADLAAIKPGDEVSFEFTSTGMDGTITTIAHN